MNNFKINDQLRITNLQQKTKNKLSLEHRKHYPIPVVKRYPSWQKYLAMQLLNLYIKSLLQCMTMMHETTTGGLLHLPKSQKTQLLHNYNPAQKVRRTEVPFVERKWPVQATYMIDNQSWCRDGRLVLAEVEWFRETCSLLTSNSSFVVMVVFWCLCLMTNHLLSHVKG